MESEERGSSRAGRRFLMVLAVAAIAIAAYVIAGRYVAYTSDAYVRSDLVAIAPQVAGIVKSVNVVDNQHVKSGDLLMVIESEPYELALALAQDRVTNAEAEIAVKSDAIKALDARLDAAKSALTLAQTDFDRISKLTSTQVVAQAVLDKQTDTLRAAQDTLAEINANIEVANRELDAANAAAEVARAEVAIRQYDLDRTRIVSPVSGYINNLTLRPGRYAAVGDEVIGIVDDSQWRVIANFKEGVAGSLSPGTKVRVWLDSHPWNLHRGTVQGIGRGIARETGRPELLPYVAPTTDWIRLQRRLPVTILLDSPVPEDKLFMGADARVFFLR